MILFLISFLMIFVSSCLLASIFSGKKYLSWLIYLLLIVFAQIVFTIELLSLFTAISKMGILILNALILLVSLYYWNKKGKPLFKPQIKKFFVQIFNACKKDKMLGIMGLGLIFFILITIFLCTLCPIINYDGLAYRINRALMWVSQGSLAHFDIADDRNINMAINVEVLYTWFFTFVPRNMFLGFFSFAGYILGCASLYSFLELCGFSMIKRLWTVFLFSSIAGVITEASGCESDLIIGALVLASLALFLQAAKKNILLPLYFSTLAVCLAIGAKTSAFFVVPSLAIIFTCILFKYQKEKFWKFTGLFFLFSFINFVVFAAYNYVLNFIEFGYFVGSIDTQNWHKMRGGIKGYISGLIRHLLLLVDFTGFKYGLYIEKFVFNMQNNLLTAMHIPFDLNVVISNDDVLNFSINDSKIGGGVIGTLVLVPCSIFAICRALFCGKTFQAKLLGVCGCGLFLSIAVMSACVGFMVYSSRFTITFLILAAPVLVYSYIKSNKNIIKYIILFWVMSYFVIISTHIWSRHFIALSKEIKKGTPVRELRTKQLCSLDYMFDSEMFFCSLRSIIYDKLPNNSRIGVFSALADNFAVLKFMEKDGYKVDPLLLEKFHKYDLNKYDYLLFTDDLLNVSYIIDKQSIMDNYYVENGALHFVDASKVQCVLKDSIKDVLVTKDDDIKDSALHLMCNIPYQNLINKGFRPYINVTHREISKKKNTKEILKNVHIFKNRNGRSYD